VLFYGTFGLAYGRVRGENVAIGFTETKVHGGYVVGGGMEVGLTPNWTARAEYLYVDLNSRGYVATGNDNGLESSILRLGVNYRF
jgi:outer membrane immunogenic protein